MKRPHIGMAMRAIGIIIFSITLASCSGNDRCGTEESKRHGPELLSKLMDVVNDVPGTIGVAVVSDSDTLLINNGVRFPMMSVFKLHQALAVCNHLDKSGQSLDSIINIKSGELDANTWSPGLKPYIGKDFTVSVGDLIRYAVVSSDNNASNLLFRHILSPAETDRYIRQVTNDTTFRIVYSEDEMSAIHSRSYANYTSPLAAAVLIRQVFNESEASKLDISADKLMSVRENLLTVTTGQDRLGAPLADRDGIVFGHKTGSGFRNENNELMAFNDVGYVQLPSGKNYAMAVLIRDFSGTEAEAAKIMAHLSSIIFNDYAEE